jgi:hypothetical protein
MRLIRLALSFMLLCAVWTSGWAQPSQQFEMSGAVKQVLKFDAAALAAFPAAETGRFTQSRSGQGAQIESTVRGVKLSALVERAGLQAAGRND